MKIIPKVTPTDTGSKAADNTPPSTTSPHSVHHPDFLRAPSSQPPVEDTATFEPQNEFDAALKFEDDPDGFRLATESIAAAQAAKQRPPVFQTEEAPIAEVPAEAKSVAQPVAAAPSAELTEAQQRELEQNNATNATSW